MTDTTHQGAEGAETMTAGQSLDLRDLHAANIARQAEWCPDQVPDLSFRGNELGGECGEAQNVIKKLERERQGWRGSRATKDDLADELADVVICADLCAVTADIDLGAAVRRKFNATSEKQGLSVFLPAPAPRTDGGVTAGEDRAWPFERTRTYLLAELERLRADLHTIGADLTGEQGKAASWLDVATGRVANVSSVLASATPAQPAGAVPDSLRALSEAMENTKAAADDLASVCIEEGDNKAAGALQFISGFISDQMAAIASHPAGQSAGSGAEAEPWKALRKIAELRFAEDACEPFDEALDLADAALASLSAPDSTRTGQGEDWRDDPSSDVRWNAGLVYGQDQLCRVLGVDPDKVSWDAATETLDGDVQSVICNILRAWAGDDWQALAARPAAPEAQ